MGWSGCSSVKAKMTLTKLMMCLVLIPAAFARNPKSAEGRIRDYILNQPDYSPRERPVLNSNLSVNVNIQVQIYGMLDLNEKDQTVTIASWTQLSWRDERLTWNPNDFEGVLCVVVYFDEIWTPRILLSNAMSFEGLQVVSANRGTILLYCDGTVFLGTSFVQCTQCAMKFRNFPFDTQSCQLVFSPENQSKQQINFTASDPRMPSSIVSNEWDFVGFSSYNNEHINTFVESDESSYISTFGIFSFQLKRDPNYYITTIVIPSTLLCLMSYATFLAPPDSGERIGLGVSMVLGLTVFQLLVTNILPTASKNGPIISTYLSNTFVLSCLAVPFSLFNITIAYGDSKMTILKHGRIRMFLLELLPRVMCLPSYQERFDGERNDNARSQIVKKEGEMVTISPVEVISKNKLQPWSSPAVTEAESLSTLEKRKLEARTLGLVMDRLVLLCFLVAYTIIVINTFARFYHSPEEVA
ncbi:neuronal acetylcholine receptor subunit beta-2-like isoform X2 [Apostichopus japonicus]|uniref:neuronal acetylcholine receptor subunit beta-2-like isoform X2 n=1 Tax=Stichopus japonicus TaxID=307972 RepID=UPI003AB8164A